MNYRLREYLIDLCAKGETISYQILSDQCKLDLDMASPGDRSKIAVLLVEVATYEHNNKRPLLTAIVIAKQTHKQGDGFFRLGEQFGYGNWQTLKENLFDKEQIKQCFEFWGSNENYSTYRNIKYE